MPRAKGQRQLKTVIFSSSSFRSLAVTGFSYYAISVAETSIPNKRRSDMQDREEPGSPMYSVVSSFLVGGVVGAVAALLLAPKSGRETRQQIKVFTEEVKDKAGDYYEQVKDAVSSAVKHGKGIVGERKDRIADAVKAGMEAFEKKE
jgi:gas vesicle protein